MGKKESEEVDVAAKDSGVIAGIVCERECDFDAGISLADFTCYAADCQQA